MAALHKFMVAQASRLCCEKTIFSRTGGWPGRTEGSPGVGVLWHRKTSATGTLAAQQELRPPAKHKIDVLKRLLELLAFDVW